MSRGGEGVNGAEEVRGLMSRGGEGLTGQRR